MLFTLRSSAVETYCPVVPVLPPTTRHVTPSLMKTITFENTMQITLRTCDMCMAAPGTVRTIQKQHKSF